jgi:hypothetical protein
MTMSRLDELVGTHIRNASEIPVLPQLTLDVWGPEHSGKSHFALTAAGSKGTFYMSTETKSLDTVIQKFAGAGPIRVGMYESDIPHGFDRTKYDQLQAYFRKVLANVKNDYELALKLGAATVVHDKSLGIWEIMRLAAFGKLEGVTAKNYGPLNIEFADLLDRAPKYGANLILINEEQDEWGNGADGKSRQVTGKKIRKGQDRTGFLVDASLRTFKRRTTAGIEFGMEIIEARSAPYLIGTVLTNPTFADVAMLLKPEIDWTERLGL